MVTDGIERYLERIEEDATVEHRRLENAPTRKLTRMAMDRVIPEVVNCQTKAADRLVNHATRGTRLAGWEAPVVSIDPRVLAFIALRGVLGYRPDVPVQGLAQAVGSAVTVQLNMERLKAGPNGSSRIRLMRRRLKRLNPRHISRFMRRLDALEFGELETDGTVRNMYQTGCALVQ
ncbi:MAG: hypothetical protein VW362_06160, partial [Candidatus Nanopelagicales bacterium]